MSTVAFSCDIGQDSSRGRRDVSFTDTKKTTKLKKALFFFFLVKCKDIITNFRF